MLVGPGSRKLDGVDLRDPGTGRSFPVIQLARALEVFNTAACTYRTLQSVSAANQRYRSVRSDSWNKHKADCRSMVLQEIIAVASPSRVCFRRDWASAAVSHRDRPAQQDALRPAWRRRCVFIKSPFLHVSARSVCLT